VVQPQGREVAGRLAELDLFGVGGRILSGILLIPYFAWGIYTLRLRYRFYEDITPRVEAITLLAVTLFFAAESFFLHRYLSDSRLLYIFSLLGLFVSGTALYGPMLVSLLSQLVVDSVLPAERSKTREPSFAPAEALERMGDLEGALREYLVVARIFPREPAALLRIADLNVTLSRPEEAVRWFERALPHIESAEKSLQITNRVSAIYARELNRPDDAIRLLQTYLEEFPDSEFADSVRDRLHRLVETRK